MPAPCAVKHVISHVAGQDAGHTPMRYVSTP